MEYYIDDHRQTERDFWYKLDGVASEWQKKAVLDGEKVIAGGMIFQIIVSDNSSHCQCT